MPKGKQKLEVSVSNTQVQESSLVSTEPMMKASYSAIQPPASRGINLEYDFKEAII